MKNKILAIFGIGTFILSALASIVNSSGESSVLYALVLISGLLTIVFIIIAIIYLWKHSKGSSILLASSSTFLFGAAIMQVVYSPSDGSPLIFLMNIAEVIYVLVFIWTISFLWRMEKYKAQFDRVQSKTTINLLRKSLYFKIVYSTYQFHS